MFVLFSASEELYGPGLLAMLPFALLALVIGFFMRYHEYRKFAKSKTMKPLSFYIFYRGRYAITKFIKKNFEYNNKFASNQIKKNALSLYDAAYNNDHFICLHDAVYNKVNSESFMSEIHGDTLDLKEYKKMLASLEK